MELAGLQVVMGADFDAFYSALSQADTMTKTFAQTIKNAFNGVPDFGKKFNFTSNGASQAAQDAREYARAAREQAAADVDAARAKDIADKAQERKNRTEKTAKDLYGQLVAESNALVRAYYNEATAQLKSGNATEEATKRLEEMRQAALASQQQLQKIEQGAGRFQRNVGNYASGFNPLRNSINQLSREMPAFANSIQTGLLGISNNLPILADAIQQIKTRNAELIAQGQPAQSVFKQIAGAILSWQTALSIGITALTVLGPKIYDFIKSGGKSAEVLKAQEENQKALNQAYSNGLKQAGEQISTIKRLNDTMTNANLSMEVRTAAYNEAVKLYPSYLSGIAKEDALSGALADTINNKLIPAIQSAAKARALQNKITTLAEQEIELREKVGKAIDEQAKAQVESDRIWSKSGLSMAKTGQVISGFIKSGAISLTADIDGAKQEVKDYTKAISDNIIEQQRLSRQLQVQMKGNRTLDNSGVDVTTIKQPKSKEPADLENLRLQIAKSYEARLDDQTEFGEKKRSIDEQIALDTKIVGGTFEKILNDQKDAEARANNARYELQRDLYGRSLLQLEAYRDAAVRATEQMKTSIVSALTEMSFQSAEILGDWVGKIGSKDWSFGSIFKDLGKMLGDQIISLGKQLAISGGIMEAFWKVVDKLGIPGGGTAAIVLGLSAIAAGAALKAALSRQAKDVGQTAFAQGGVVYGPTNALIGEYSGARSNPEVVAPLDKLKSILNAGNMGQKQMVPYILASEIKGQDLRLILKRADNYFNR